MLTPVEKVIVNLTVLGMALLLSFAIYTSMPTHARIIASRFWFYVSGTVEEFREAVLGRTEELGARSAEIVKVNSQEL